ncbi:MAG: transcription antitermination factor NusB [Deltaproteobacteria bacterium]
MRRASRERVFQTLFMMDVLGVGPEKAIPLFALVQGDPPDSEYYRETLTGVWNHREEIDALIREAAQNWRLERMTFVDRNLLRLGTYEILHAPDVPYAVAINEAVELGKKFGSAESGGFLNGILDRISEITHQKGNP